jgi:hypothetical protein
MDEPATEARKDFAFLKFSKRGERHRDLLPAFLVFDRRRSGDSSAERDWLALPIRRFELDHVAVRISEVDAPASFGPHYDALDGNPALGKPGFPHLKI